MQSVNWILKDAFYLFLHNRTDSSILKYSANEIIIPNLMDFIVHMHIAQWNAWNYD